MKKKKGSCSYASADVPIVTFISHSSFVSMLIELCWDFTCVGSEFT